MTIALFSDSQSLRECVDAVSQAGPVVALHAGAHPLAGLLRASLADPDRLIAADVRRGELSRVNFDAVAAVILDLTAEELLSSAGRRLVDVLGRLAQEELVLALVGDPVSLTGALLIDGVTAGLNLIPRTVVLVDVAGVHNLHDALAAVRDAGLRILACDGSVGVVYTHGQDAVRVHGRGTVLLGALRAGQSSAQPTMRLQVLTAGMTSGWPA